MTDYQVNHPIEVLRQSYENYSKTARKSLG
jgi:hypothetical protein